jgi:hypothetical protein
MLSSIVCFNVDSIGFPFHSICFCELMLHGFHDIYEVALVLQLCGGEHAWWWLFGLCLLQRRCYRSNILVLCPFFEGGQVLKSANSWPWCASASFISFSFILECFAIFCSGGLEDLRVLFWFNCCLQTITGSLMALYALLDQIIQFVVQVCSYNFRCMWLFH